ncbi:MAG: type 2 isopentenyl-diphosphate Delta-isomerase [Candidatus Odinarchaeia archaeon]
MIQDRKLDHIKICTEEEVESRSKTSGFEDIELIHRAVPRVSKSEIDLSVEFLGHKFKAPFLISAMTGGHPVSEKINANLAEAAQTLGIGLGVGSQRAAIEDPSLEYTFKVAREKAPDIFLIGNLGIPQISQENGLECAKKAVDMIDANALAIHLNPLQEAIQPEGETDYTGVLNSIANIANNINVPVIVKETGAGICWEDANKLRKCGVAAIDISGVGGTSWAAVESHRLKNKNKTSTLRNFGEIFWDWGIPTAVSTAEVAYYSSLPVIASGGIRSGLDAAKAIALGASMVGIALPLLKPALKSPESVVNLIKSFIEELRITMYLVGASNINELKRVKLVILGKTANWLKARGVNIDKYVKRSRWRSFKELP